MFSARTPAALTPNRLARRFVELRADGRPIADLTSSNPTCVGLDYPFAAIDRALCEVGAGAYHPASFGSRAAREAVASDQARRGLEMAPERLCLTASTSEAYAHLFELLCDPGDEILVPRPGYPLFEHLARLAGVRARHYDLAPGGFAFDVDRVEAVLGDRARAVVVVSPNNPTGTVASHARLSELSELAAARGLAIVADEVFADYAERAPSALAAPGALRFVLGGLSKSAGMPQLKLSWIAADGPGPLVDEALARLELIADAFLSVSSPVQRALPELLRIGADIRADIDARVRSNRARLRSVVDPVRGARVLPCDGGWYAVVELPDGVEEESLAVELLESHGVLAHPGHFFDMPGEHLVVSLLVAPEILERGGQVLAARLRRT